MTEEERRAAVARAVAIAKALNSPHGPGRG
jgi:hypothetical protein